MSAHVLGEHDGRLTATEIYIYIYIYIWGRSLYGGSPYIGRSYIGYLYILCYMGKVLVYRRLPMYGSIQLTYRMSLISNHTLSDPAIELNASHSDFEARSRSLCTQEISIGIPICKVHTKLQ